MNHEFVLLLGQFSLVMRTVTGSHLAVIIFRPVSFIAREDLMPMVELRKIRAPPRRFHSMFGPCIKGTLTVM